MLREHRQRLPCWLSGRLAWAGHGRLPRGPPSPALRIPLHCHRGQSCAHGDQQPGRQGPRRNRSRPGLGGGGDQKHHPHPSCFCNSAHQHLGGATLWGSSPTPSHAKDRQMCRIEGRAENLIKSKEPHRSCKLLGLSKKIEVQGSDCGSIRVT